MKNKTFLPGADPSLNAVVGNSWPVDKNYSYVLGFEQAVEVLLASAVQELYVDPITQEPKAVYIDALIYPICFCARHFIELFLKRQILLTSSLRGQPDNAAGTHDLASLWLRLQSHLPADSRLAPLAAPMGEFISDFAAIDETGETFRYAFDLKDNLHLEGLTHINLGILAERLKSLREYAENFELQMEVLINEYRWRTYTSKLSREEIRQIAKKLPPYKNWGSEDFKPIKSAIQVEFGLSSNDFNRAVCVIKKHREFSCMIGIEIPLEGVSIDIFERLKNISVGAADYESLSNDEWVRLAAICEIGRIDEYSEAYDFLLELYKTEEYQARAYSRDVFREMLGRHNRFRTGLKKLGQPTLLSKFEENFPKAPEEPRKSQDDLRAIFKQQLERMRSKTESDK